MNSDFLSYFDEELSHIRSTAGEFARDFPKIASRLNLDDFSCADPYVERLLEGFAFMAARVRLKLDQAYPRMAESLLLSAFPQALSPVPSFTVIELTPKEDRDALRNGLAIPKGMQIKSRELKITDTQCTFSVARDLTLWPIRLKNVSYLAQDLGTLPIDTRMAPAALSIDLSSWEGLPFNSLAVDSLPFYVNAAESDAQGLLEQLTCQTDSIIIHSAKGDRSVELPASAVRIMGVAPNEHILPQTTRQFSGFRLLREYMSFPRGFQFFELSGLKSALKSFDSEEVTITFLLSKRNEKFARLFNASTLLLNCAPAVNIFSKRIDRINFTKERYEQHIVPDRTHPRDFEVYSTAKVYAYDKDNQIIDTVHQFYQGTEESQSNTFYAAHRKPRQISNLKNARSSYRGSELFLELGGDLIRDRGDEIYQLGVEVLCTNRDLPLMLPSSGSGSDFTLVADLPIDRVRAVVAPSPPREALAGGELAWSALSLLRANYLMLTDTEGGDASESLKNLLRLFAEGCDEGAKAQALGVRDVSSERVVRRIEHDGPLCFVRGLEVSITFDETLFSGSGCFLLGVMLNEFFSNYVTINSFVETVINSIQRGVICRWKPTLQAGRALL